MAAAPFVNWVYEQVRDQLQLDKAEGSSQYKQFLDSMSVDSFSLSGARRVQSFHIIKYGYPARRAGYVVAAFRVKCFAPGSMTVSHETHYAYAYWPRQPRFGAVAEEPEYVCLSPTFDSRDGEYRHRFIWYPQFHEGYEANVPNLSKIEDRLLRLQNSDEVGIDTLVYSNDDVARQQVGRCIKTKRLDLKTLVAVLATDALRFKVGTLQTHAAPSYVTLFTLLHEQFAGVFANWSQADKESMSVFETGRANQPLRTQCGQKLMPLTIREAIQVCDINFAPWREIWVSQRVTDLVVNGVAPMFAISNNWFYLDGVDRDLFGNEAMHTRYVRSQNAEEITEKLLQGRELADKVSEKDYRMGQFDAHMHRSIEYAREFILLTDLAMCATSEYVGMTLGSVADIIRRSPTVSPAFFRMFAEPSMLVRYLFDICYGTALLHRRCGVIHTDLHQNNLTIHELESQYVGKIAKGEHTFTPRYSNPVIAYIAGDSGEVDTYVFPHDGWFASIIDFSRAIVGPAARQDIVGELGESVAAGFYRDQVPRALRALHAYVPNFFKQNQEQLKGLMYTNFEAMFRVLTAIDFIAIGQNCGALFKDIAARQEEPPRAGEVHALKIAAEGAKYAEKIAQIANDHLVVHLVDLIAGGKTPAHIGDTILRDVFSDYRYSAWVGGETPAHVGFSFDQTTLVAVYNGAAPLTYSGSNYVLYPPWARFEELEPHLGNINIAQITADRGTRPFLESRSLDEYLVVLQEHISQSVQSKPAAATSSWIVD